MGNEENNGLRGLPGIIKKAAAVFFSAAVITAGLPAVTSTVLSAQAQDAIYAKSTASLNIRQGAGMNYSILSTISKDADLTVIDKADRNWIKVKTADGVTGYCSADYLRITTLAKTETYLDLRKGPGTNYASVRTIAPGTKLTIVKFSGNSWIMVKLEDGTTGYICNDYDYISYIKNESTDTKVRTDADTREVKKTSAQANLSISEKTKTLSVGKNFTLTATTNSGGSFTWSSSDRSVATVTSKGVVTAVKVGKATITATDSKSSTSVSCTVTVTKAVLDSIKVNPTWSNLTLGQTLTINPTVSPSNGKVTYISSDTSIATVTSTGIVKGIKVGIATITIKDASGGSAKAYFKVAVKQKNTISISSTSQTIRAGTNCRLSATVSGGGSVKWTSSNTNVAAVKNGVVSGIGAGSAVITATDQSGLAKATCKVTVTGLDSSGISLSRYNGSVTAGKTLYIRGYTSTSRVWWNTSDSSIATVSEGFILGKNPGKCAITLTDSYGHRIICAVTVYDAAPIRFTYSSPNSATKNSTVKLIAITDKKRTGVRFDVKNGSNTISVNASSKVADGDTYVWTGYYKPSTAGTFNYAAYATANGTNWYTCVDGKADIYVSDKTDKKATAIEKLRASDEVIKFIGEKEGFVSNITYDTLANNIPTLAHGYVVWEGQTFYNGLTRNEGYALLVDAVNNDSYTSSVNSMLISNNVRFNQQQFDALVSFSYNLGTGWTYSSDLKNILMNSYGTVTTSSGNSMTAVVNVSYGLNLRESYTTNSKVIEVLGGGDKVTLLSTQKYNSVWYKVKTSSGKVGYCSGTYLTLNSSSSGYGRDLNYVNKNALIRELLSYHHAGGVCYYGLLYRRVDEAEMYIYGDYATDGRSNNHNFPSPSCLSF